ELLPMNCQRCGEVCRCDQEASATATPPPLPAANESALVSPQQNGASTDPSDEIASAWRDELSTKLSNYRARRKPRPPRYPSLRLRFEAESSTSAPVNPELPAFETISNQALALDGMTELPAAAEAEWEPSHSESSDGPAEGESSRIATSPRPSQGARIIEFPRSPEFRSTEFLSEFQRSEPTPPASYNELAGPVM